MSAKGTAAIVGPGNIGTDLMFSSCAAATLSSRAT